MGPVKITFGASLFSAEPEIHWRLPRRLSEVSGLALTPDGRMLLAPLPAGIDEEIIVGIDADDCHRQQRNLGLTGQPNEPASSETSHPVTFSVEFPDASQTFWKHGDELARRQKGQRGLA